MESDSIRSEAQYLTRTYRVSTHDEDRLVGFLADVGTTGIEVRSVSVETLHLIAYFDTVPPGHPQLPESVRQEIGGVYLVAEEWVETRDWLEEFRRQAQPIEIGRRFVIDPGELMEPMGTTEDRFLLRLPARTAFGTGSHETTQLSLEWLEEIPLEGQSLLDVGSGSGILSLAALRLGAATVAGFDLDLPSALMSGQYARINDIPQSEERLLLYAGTSIALSTADPTFDVIVVNVLPHRVLADLPQIVSQSSPGGELVVSGLLVTEEKETLAHWEALGMQRRERKVKGEWVAWRLTNSRRDDESAVSDE